MPGADKLNVWPSLAGRSFDKPTNKKRLGMEFFEENEIDKRLQLEVRASHIEKHLGIDKKIAA